MGEVYALFLLIVFSVAGMIMTFMEYRRSGYEYLNYVSAALGFACLWHLNNVIASALDPTPQRLYLIGNAALTLTSLAFLRAYQLLFERDEKALIGLLLGIFVVCAVCFALMPGIWTRRFLSLGAVAGLLVPVGYVFASHKRSSLYWIMALFQLFMVTSFVVGVLYLINVDRESGSVIYFLLAILLPGTGILFFQASLSETTQRMEASERDYRSLFESVRDTFFRIDNSGVIKEISPSVAQFGYARTPLLGRSLASLYEVPGKFDQDFARMQHEPTIPHLPVKIRTTRDEVRDSELSVNQVVSEDGTITGFVGTIRDVDERNQLERQFLDAQRRESMGVMAGGVAHDFNNILQGIVGHADWVLSATDMPTEERNEHLRVILDASTTAATLCRQLLEYTGRSHSEMLPISMVSAVRDVLDMFRHSVPEKIRISSTVKDTNLVVNADATQLRQVTLNLLKNAIDAMDDAGEIRVRLGSEYFSREQLSTARPGEHKLTEGHYAVLSVEDTGKGIDQEALERVFDPFYSTKALGHGLGLAAVIGIVRTHNGGILVSSTPGEGTQFKVLLPLSDAGATFKSIRSLNEHDGSGHTVLIVDDEEDIRRIVRTILEDRRYTTLLAGDGDEAVKLYKENEASISAIIMDVKMPNKDGISAVREIRSINQNVPILIASGYADIAGRITSTESLTYNFIAKPYRRQEILDALADVLPGEVRASGQGTA